MKKILTILFIGVIAMQNIGCSSKSQSNQEYNNTPQWVKIPYIKGYITGLGVSPSNRGDDIALQRSEAMAVARDEIARTVETKVSSFVDKFVESTGVKEKESFARDVKHKIRTVTKQKIKGARVKKSWMSESGKLYILMVLESSEVVKAVKHSSGSLRNKDTKFQRFLSEESLKELEEELERYGS